MTQHKLPSILMIMLCMRCMIGGAEKRYARVFRMLTAQPEARHKLVINRSMLELLQTAGVLSQDDEPHLIVLDPPFRHYALKHRIFSIFQPVLALLDIIWYIWQCWRLIHSYKPQIVHPLLTGMYLSLPALLLRPKIYHVMSAYAIQFKPDNYTHSNIGANVGYVIKRYAMQRSHAIDALTESIQDDLTGLGIDRKKIYVAPCSFTDISLCQPASQRKKWVVFLARFIEFKNPLLLAQAIPKVIAKEPDVHFYFLGWGELQSQLETLLQTLDVINYVSIQFESQPTQILNQSSIFVSLQNGDNYPSQSLIEAMACGNAIVATDVGETWRLVDDKNGVRVPPTADAVAEAIIRLLRDPMLPQRGLVSRQRVLSEYTPERFFDYITNLYRTVATEPDI